MGRLPVPDTPIAEVLRTRLADLRRAGEPFDRAWPAALNEALVLAGGTARREWAQVLGETIGAWRAGYEREPTRTLATFASMLELCDAASEWERPAQRLSLQVV